MHNWEPVIGLEIHAQLNTRSKLFSPAPNRFGDEPNTNISAVCTGQPGALPLLNREAVKKAIQFGLAIHGKISLASSFSRKSYFYPDTPRNFQITQYEDPIVRSGSVTLDIEGNTRSFPIKEVHLEDDAGMLKHFTHFAGVDYNRAGAPLIEIVTEPCFRNSKEAAAFAMEVRSILLYLDACDGNMEEGSLRFDANVSVRRVGETVLRPRAEIKNLNSFSFLEMALAGEIERQIALYTKEPNRPWLELIPPGTYRWDSSLQKTILMRAKESADDYRYFPEPDLPPIFLSVEMIDRLRDELPELPRERFRRYISDFSLSEHSAFVLTREKKLADYFEAANRICQSPKNLCNWMIVEFSGRLKESGKSLVETAISPEQMASLVRMIDSGKLTGPMAKQVADKMVLSPGKSPEEIVQGNPDFQPLDNAQEIEALIDRVMQANPQSVLDFQAGKERAFGFLVGQVMKLSQGKASPSLVNDLLRQKLSSK
ncbi:MAG: Asp-tRNA(Asn)/Glu-tRNA(Gln) amidotransferase subunit GatB [Verrucomicrobiota bacterium]|nr:Asp-tRNA(Asn)/Glu-tRNA(Gln) amidotransferase subunit GatB [Verrucomicrobiota bacterium]